VAEVQARRGGFGMRGAADSAGSRAVRAANVGRHDVRRRTTSLTRARDYIAEL